MAKQVSKNIPVKQIANVGKTVQQTTKSVSGQAFKQTANAGKVIQQTAKNIPGQTLKQADKMGKGFEKTAKVAGKVVQQNAKDVKEAMEVMRASSKPIYIILFYCMYITHAGHRTS